MTVLRCLSLHLAAVFAGAVGRVLDVPVVGWVVAAAVSAGSFIWGDLFALVFFLTAGMSLADVGFGVGRAKLHDRRFREEPPVYDPIRKAAGIQTKLVDLILVGVMRIVEGWLAMHGVSAAEAVPWLPVQAGAVATMFCAALLFSEVRSLYQHGVALTGRRNALAEAGFGVVDAAEAWGVRRLEDIASQIRPKDRTGGPPPPAG